MSNPDSYQTDSKVIRIPSATKTRLDNLKPPGVELWKFAGDIGAIGLATYKKLREDPTLQDICDYKMAEVLAPKVKAMLCPPVEK